MNSSKTWVAVAVAAVALACAGTMAAEPKDSGTHYAEEALKPWVADGRLPGAISVMYDNGVQETACVGYADVAAKRKITMDDAFMQCSQTKGFCGVTVAILVEEGKLNLDDRVSKYLPEYKWNQLWVQVARKNGVRVLAHPDEKDEPTVRMCLNHTVGFEFELPAKQAAVRGGGWSGAMPLRSVAAEAAALPLQFTPGTKAAYSNTGIDVGAAVVEVVTGMKWENFLKLRVLDPLGMKDTGFWPSDKQLETQIEMYDCVKDAPARHLRENGWQQRPYNDGHVFASAGAGLWTTANDQLKFYKMLMNLGVGDNGVRILKEETVKSILALNTRPVAVAKRDGGYSLGLSAPVADGENEWFGHGGAWGTQCMVNWHKKQLKLWVVQLNGGPRPWDKALSAARDKFFAQKIDNSAADAYTGRVTK